MGVGATLCKVTLKSLGIYSYSAPPYSPGREEPIVARLYCEQMLISS